MTFEGFDAALPIELGTLPVGALMAARGEAGTLEQALQAAGLAERMMAEGEILDSRAARESLTVLDLHVDARGGDRLSAFDLRGGAAAGKLDDGPATGGPDPTIMTPGGTPPPGGYVDSNGNGQYDPGEEQVIVVNGRRPNEMDEGEGSEDGGWPWEPNPGNDAGGGTPGDGGGGGPAPNQQKEDADDTPCVDEVPDGHTADEINDLAKHMGTVLASLQDSTGHEWGAFIYRGSNGQLYQSAPFTAGLYDSMDGAIGSIPPGAVIVGYLHTHPTDVDSDQRNLSSVDRQFINNLIENGHADSNMLAYVVTRDKDLGYSDSYDTFVYDKSKRTSTSPGCDL